MIVRKQTVRGELLSARQSATILCGWFVGMTALGVATTAFLQWRRWRPSTDSYDAGYNR